MHRFKFLILLIIITAAFTSCKKLVEVEVPKSNLLRKNLFNNDKSAESALNGMYAHIRGNGLLCGDSYFGAIKLYGWYSDEFDYYASPTSDNYKFYQYQLFPDTRSIQTMWQHSYQTIFMANAILEGEKEAHNLAQDVKDRMIGEALFVRAIMHFYLSNLYGDIPFVTSTDFHITRLQPKISVKEVYKLALEDLLKAESLLKESYPTSERVRPNKWVVKSLLSRVYLYNEDWNNASIKSAEVIAQSQLYKLESDLNNVFLKGSKEAIWQIKPGTETANARDASLILTYDPYITDGAPVSKGLLNAHEPGDQRKEKWIGTFMWGDVEWKYINKYKQGSVTTPASLEYSILFRLAEQYLIQAEALAQQNNLDGALQYLNMIRNRAGLPSFSSSSKEDILEAILKERRIELSTEYGHRFFDLKRTKNAEKYLKSVKPSWKNEWLYWPIPQFEIDTNPNLLPQNPGYN